MRLFLALHALPFVPGLPELTGAAAELCAERLHHSFWDELPPREKSGRRFADLKLGAFHFPFCVATLTKLFKRPGRSNHVAARPFANREF